MSRMAKFVLGLGVWGFMVSSNPLRAQAAGDTLAGVVTDPSGQGIPNATISVKSVATGQATETHTDSAGLFAMPKLKAGDYDVSVSAPGFSANPVRVTMAGEALQTLNLTLRVAPSLGLGDLGFSPAQTQGSAQDQARLDKRSHMLQVHQRLGLITTLPLAATVISSLGAGGRSTSSASRDLHAGLGTVTMGLYFTTAYFAIFAPKIPGTHARGPIRLHKALAWIHFPGMILTPVLGAMAFDQRSRGERVHGIASAHGIVAIVTAAAYGASILSVSLKF